MPPEENDAMPDAFADQAHGNDACSDSSDEQETTSRLSRFQEVGTSTRSNNAGEDADTTDASFSVGTQAAADDLPVAAVSGGNNTGAAGPLPPSESNTSTSTGAAEAEDDEQNQHVISDGQTAGVANGVTANDKDYAEESYVHAEATSSTAGEKGQTNGDDNATDVAVAPSTRGDASAGQETSLTSDSIRASSAVSSSDGNGNSHRPTCAQKDIADLNNRTAATIRRSFHETPGAFHVTPRPRNAPRGEEGTADEEISGPDASATGNSGSNSNDPDHTDTETEQEETPSSDTISQPRRRSTATSPNRPTESHPSITLAEAWVVGEVAAGAAGAAGAANPSAALPPTTSTRSNGRSESSVSSLDIDASVEPAIVTVTATPLKERTWFKTPSGIALILFLILLLGGIVALAVFSPVRKSASNTAAASRPFDIVIPSMPQDVSDMLEFKYNKLVKGQAVAMTFSADLSLHASSRFDAYYGQLQVVQYNATSSSWDVVAKYEEKEARKQDAEDGQIGNSAGDNFGAWADMSYDGRILAIGLPRDDPLNIPDAGSVRVMKMGMALKESDLNDDAHYPWDLKGHGDFIIGVDPFSWTGSTFSLTADGSMIAVASPIASKSRGNIMVYKFESDDATANGGGWTKIGQTITGDAFGSALSFAKLTHDGSILGAGSFLNGDDQSGQLRIFQWDDTANLWVQLGSTMEGKAKARLGVFPHFSRDGRTVAFSQTGDPHKCHVYQWDEVDNDWGRIDDEQVFPDSYICMDLSPDGKKIILCSTEEQRCILNLLHSVGEWHEAQWHEAEVFPKVDGFMPYHFEREGNGDKIAGIVIPIGNEKGFTIGFYNIK